MSQALVHARTATEQAAPGLRRAALLLHAVHPADQAWLLQSFDDPERSTLSSLLAELRQIGVQPDWTLVQAAMGPGTAGRVTPANQHSVQADIERLDQADSGVICRLLTGEPDRLIARLLALHAWSWRDNVLEHVGVSRRRSIVELQQVLAESLGTSGVGAFSRLDRGLVGLVLERVGQPHFTGLERRSSVAVRRVMRWCALLRGGNRSGRSA